MHKPRDTVGGFLPLLQSAAESPAMRGHCSEDTRDLVDLWERALPWPAIQARSLEVEANAWSCPWVRVVFAILGGRGRKNCLEKFFLEGRW